MLWNDKPISYQQQRFSAIRQQRKKNQYLEQGNLKAKRRRCLKKYQFESEVV